jgi:hypothetical protein
MQVEDLKQQLDDALEAEEMLVKLTARNLELGEVSWLRASSIIRLRMTMILSVARKSKR